MQTICKRLNRASPCKLRGLVGVDSRIEKINKLLSIVSSDVRIIGIWGMGGIGKTTIAEAFFYSISSQFEVCHFLPNIRKESEKGRLNDLRDELLSKLLEEENVCVGTPHIGPTFIRDRLCQKKVLLVLDDVNDARQFQQLIEVPLIGAGSVVVVTSRDKQVLKNVADEIYEVEELNSHEALQLFSLNAFKGNHPPKDFMELSITAINYAKGNPLALQVLGSYLFDKGRQFWESQLNEIESFPELNIYDLLRIGFDALRDNNSKSIFHDIACFFRGHQVDFVKRILDGCGFKTDIGFSVLIDRCLIKISDDKVEMHDLLQQMAHEVVRKESLDGLGRQSRLWSSKDVYQVLTNNLVRFIYPESFPFHMQCNMVVLVSLKSYLKLCFSFTGFQGTGKVEGIFLDVTKIREIELSSTALERMYKLRLLKIYNSEAGVKCRVHLPHGLVSLSEELRYLHWDGYPLTSLPSNFRPQNLVEINLSCSKVNRLWRGNQVF